MSDKDFIVNLLSPPSLKEIMVEYVREHIPKVFFNDDAMDKEQRTVLKGYISPDTLPPNLWDLVFQSHIRVGPTPLKLLMGLSSKALSQGLRINRIILKNCKTLTDAFLEEVMSNCPSELDIHHCPSLTENAFHIINKFGINLKALNVGDSVQILPRTINIEKEAKCSGVATTETPCSSGDSADYYDNFNHLKTPKLEKIVIWGLVVQQKQRITSNPTELEVDYWETLLSPCLSGLVYLDMSFCHEIVDFYFLLGATKSLKTLILHDVVIPQSYGGFDAFNQLVELRHLDISQSLDLAAVFNNPDALLERTVLSLTKLRQIDISGTNLAGYSLTNIEGLVSRTKNPLQFLGLFGVHRDAANRPNIPALQMTGTYTNDQIFLSLKRYFLRPEMLQKTLWTVFSRLKSNAGLDAYPEYLEMVLKVLEIHLENKSLTIVGLAVLFNLLKKFAQPESVVQMQLLLSTRLRNKVVKVALKSSRIHNYDVNVLRNSALLLCFLDPGKDMNVCRVILIEMVLNTIKVSLEDPDDFLLRTACYLLKPVAIYTTVAEREKLGKLGAIEKICTILSTLVVKSPPLHLAGLWLVLETLTDGVSDNSLRFIKAKGVKLFLKMKNMPFCSNYILTAALAALTNAASDSRTASLLMKDEFIQSLMQIMNEWDSSNANCLAPVQLQHMTQLTYSAAACMVQLLHYNQDFDYKDVTRVDIRNQLSSLLTTWDVSTDIRLDFSTMENSIRLLESRIKECQAFGAWTIANLTTISPQKYVPMLGATIVSKLEKVDLDGKLGLYFTFWKNKLTRNIENYFNERKGTK